MSIIAALKEFFNGCPLLKGQIIQVDNTWEDPGSTGVFPKGETVLEQYFDGGSYRKYDFSLFFRRPQNQQQYIRILPFSRSGRPVAGSFSRDPYVPPACLCTAPGCVFLSMDFTPPRVKINQTSKYLYLLALPTVLSCCTP